MTLARHQRYPGAPSAVGRRVLDDTPLSDGPIDFGKGWGADLVHNAKNAARKDEIRGNISRLRAARSQDSDVKAYQAWSDFSGRSRRKSINFVERFKHDPETGARRIARPGYPTSLPRQRALTGSTRSYLGLPGSSTEFGTGQGVGRSAGQKVDYQLTGNRRVRKAEQSRGRRAAGIAGSATLGAAGAQSAHIGARAGHPMYRAMMNSIKEDVEHDPSLRVGRRDRMIQRATAGAMSHASTQTGGALYPIKVARSLGLKRTATVAGAGALTAGGLTALKQHRRSQKKPVGKAFRSARILADVRGLGTRNPTPTKQAARTAQDLEQAFLRERRPDLLRRTQSASRARSDRIYENGPRFRPISARQSTFTRSGVGKAARYYDGEHKRQRRLGAMAAVGAAGGAALIGVGGRNIARSTKAVRRIELGPVGKPGTRGGGGKVADIPLRQYVNESELPGVRGHVYAARHRDAAMIGGGTVALGGAGLIQNTANGRRHGIWR